MAVGWTDSRPYIAQWESARVCDGVCCQSLHDAGGERDARPAPRSREPHPPTCRHSLPPPFAEMSGTPTRGRDPSRARGCGIPAAGSGSGVAGAQSGTRRGGTRAEWRQPTCGGRAGARHTLRRSAESGRGGATGQPIPWGIRFKPPRDRLGGGLYAAWQGGRGGGGGSTQPCHARAQGAALHLELTKGEISRTAYSTRMSSTRSMPDGLSNHTNLPTSRPGGFDTRRPPAPQVLMRSSLQRHRTHRSGHSLPTKKTSTDTSKDVMIP